MAARVEIRTGKRFKSQMGTDETLILNDFDALLDRKGRVNFYSMGKAGTAVSLTGRPAWPKFYPCSFPSVA